MFFFTGRMQFCRQQLKNFRSKFETKFEISEIFHGEIQRKMVLWTRNMQF